MLCVREPGAVCEGAWCRVREPGAVCEGAWCRV